MDTLTKNLNYIGIAGCALSVVGLFLPFASAYGFSANYIDGDGKIMLFTRLATAVLLFFKKDLFSLIPTAISTIMIVAALSNILGGAASLGIGAYVIIIGLVIQIAEPLVAKFVIKNN